MSDLESNNMARTGMSVLIENIRSFCNLGTNDYTLGTATYWTDDQVQTVLDRHKTDVWQEELIDEAVLVSAGSSEYKIFYSRYGNYEQTTGGTAVFIIENSEGGDLGTSLYSVDYANGIVTFGADQQGSSRYLTGVSYDIYMAASDVWRMKASAYGEAVNFETDNMQVDRGDLIKNCLQMANYYASQGKTKSLVMDRGDC